MPPTQKLHLVAGSGELQPVQPCCEPCHGAVDVGQLVQAEQADPNVEKSAGSSHISGTPAAAWMPTSRKRDPDWSPGSSVWTTTTPGASKPSAATERKPRSASSARTLLPRSSWAARKDSIPRSWVSRIVAAFRARASVGMVR